MFERDKPRGETFRMSKWLILKIFEKYFQLGLDNKDFYNFSQMLARSTALLKSSARIKKQRTFIALVLEKSFRLNL